jgi:TolB-like protein/Tfp pilus assembly protein PilF
LLIRIWGGRIVSSSAIATAINLARQAVADSGEAQSIIRTFPRKGVRFVAEVSEQADTPSTATNMSETPSMAEPNISNREKPAIAVLPFTSFGEDPEQADFADGIVEDLNTALSRVRSLFVIARNSCFAYKGLAIDVRQIGRELGVRYVLEGSVRKDSSRVRVTAQLIEAENGNHVWAERYDRPLSDIIDAQDAITERVVAALEPEIYAAENARIGRKRPNDLNAWECLIRAMAALGQGTAEGITGAEAYCRQAIEIAPHFAQAYSLLAWILVRRPFYTGLTGIEEAYELVRLALALDERDAWAHLAHGTVFWRLRRPVEAERALRRALDLNPNFALAQAVIAMPLMMQGKHQAAITYAENALKLSPVDPLEAIFATFAIGMAMFGAAQYDQALQIGRDMTAKWPAYVPAHLLLLVAAQMCGDRAATASALADLRLLKPDLSMRWLMTNTSFSGDLGDRYLEAMRAAGIPEN